MPRLSEVFVANRRSAQQALDRFLPFAGREYASGRNFVHPLGSCARVSGVSPWVRTRLLPEWELAERVLAHHGAVSAEKFIEEVCWRTYWKGWLQLRPAVWEQYVEELESVRQLWRNDSRYLSLLEGCSGIQCMDDWTLELQQSGYLHNHVRMWYASIWIHTLKIPWVLGADFFLQHLLDGDAACNTLSWRWVAGLHTAGKTYLARPDNIRHYTEGRVEVDLALAAEPMPVQAPPIPVAGGLPDLGVPPARGSRVGLLLQEDDLSALQWLSSRQAPTAVAGYLPVATYAEFAIASAVIQFRLDCMLDALPGGAPLFEAVQAVVDWALSHRLELVLMAEVPVGLWNEPMRTLSAALRAAGIRLAMQRSAWDAYFHPLAKAGFFRFKQGIPDGLKLLIAPP